MGFFVVAVSCRTFARPATSARTDSSPATRPGCSCARPMRSLTPYLRRASRLKNPDPSRVTIVEGDVLDLPTLTAAMKGKDYRITQKGEPFRGHACISPLSRQLRSSPQGKVGRKPEQREEPREGEPSHLRNTPPADRKEGDGGRLVHRLRCHRPTVDDDAPSASGRGMCSSRSCRARPASRPSTSPRPAAAMLEAGSPGRSLPHPGASPASCSNAA